MQVPTTHIRAMTMADLAAVIENEKRAYTFPWSEGLFADCLSANYHSYVLCSGEKVLGHCIVSMAAGEAHLLNICVQREHQGLGLGKNLLQHAFGLCDKHNVDALFLEVRASNKKALKLYFDHGFREIGVRKEYYPGDPHKEDALVLAFNFSSD